MERRYQPPKTCPRQDRGSRLANNPGLSPEIDAMITIGALSTNHPLGADIQARKNPSFQHRITAENQILTPLTRRSIRPVTSDGRGSIYGGKSEKTRTKHRKRAREEVSRMKGKD